jgi:acetyltransferase-like isoleucine patch superfamily enzyme
MSMLNRLMAKIYMFVKVRANTHLNESRRSEIESIATVSKTAELSISEINISNSSGNKANIKIGEYTRIRGELIIFKSNAVIEIGDYCFIGQGSRIWSAKKIVIGNRVLISHNVNIHDNISHPLNAALRHKDFIDIYSEGLQEDSPIDETEIIIGDDAWIGFNASILKGVKIGKGAIIGAGAVITKDVPDFAIVVGNPQRIVKYTD